MTVGLCCACSNNQSNAVHLDSEEDSVQTVTKSDSMAAVSEMGSRIQIRLRQHSLQLHQMEQCLQVRIRLSKILQVLTS